MGQIGDLVPGKTLGGAATAIVGTYSSTASETAQNCDCSHSTTAHMSIYTKSPHRIVCPVQQEGGGCRGCKELPAVGEKGDLDPGLCLSKAKETIAGAGTGNTSETAQNSLCDQHELRAYMGSPCLSTLPLWGKGPGCREKKKHTLERNRANSGLTCSTSPPATWV